MDISPKSQKEYYHNKIREYEKRTGKSMNVKGVSKEMYYDVDLSKAKLNLTAALELLDQYYYIYHDFLNEEDIYSNGTNWNKYAYGKYKGKIHIFYYEKFTWGPEVSKDIIIKYNEAHLWNAKKLPATKIIPPDNKHIGSNFDDFAKENNIELTRDMNWALKMLEFGKIVTREGNPKIYLFPPDKYDNSQTKISAEDLFAKDWQIFHLKTFKDVLDDLYKGKSIRSKSWPNEWEIGEYSNSVLIRYADMLADDWEVVDVVAEVNKEQQNIINSRSRNCS